MYSVNTLLEYKNYLEDGDIMQLFNKLDKPVFIKKDSDIDEYISKLMELQEKSSGKIKEKIDLEIKLATIGQFGEKTIAFELMNSGIPMYILHDIHIEIDGLTAQIDYIVITRKVNFVIECKNLIGNITVDRDGNFIREYQIRNRKIKEGIYSPITQNSRHMEVLKQIRKRSKSNILLKFMFDKFFNENYKSIVVLANSKTILNDRYAKKDVRDMIIRADQLIKYIKDINDKSDIIASSDKEMKDFALEILSLHTPSKSDYTKKYEKLLSNSGKEPEINIVNTNGGNNKENENLYMKLKAFRLEKSREENIKAYYIFTDVQLEDLIDRLPRSIAELKNISGFGKVKVEKYGDMIVEIINESNL